MPRKPEIARSVVVLPAPLVPRRATICPRATVSDDALHRGDGAVIDHLELVDGEQRHGAIAHLRAPRDRPMLERPQQKVGLDAAPDADEAERLEQQEQDHHDAEGGVVDGEQHRRHSVCASGSDSSARLDHIGKQRDEDGAEQRAEQRAHAADDDHRDILDGEEQRERLDRDEAAVIGEQRAGDRGDRRRDHEGEQLVGRDIDAERFGHGLVRADRAPGAAGAAAQQVDADQQRERRRRRAGRNTRRGRRRSRSRRCCGASMMMPVEKPRLVSYSPPR